jgi:hypothetical protein
VGVCAVGSAFVSKPKSVSTGSTRTELEKEDAGAPRTERKLRRVVTRPEIEEDRGGADGVPAEKETQIARSQRAFFFHFFFRSP